MLNAVEKDDLCREYGSAGELIKGEFNRSLHVECDRNVSAQLLQAVKDIYQKRRCAYLLETDRGYERETVKSYLRFFARVAGSTKDIPSVLCAFGLDAKARKRLKECDAVERGLVAFARMSLFEPELCFCERPLSELDADARKIVLRWIDERVQSGTLFITTLDPLRVATLLPGDSFWSDEGRFMAAEFAEDDEVDHGELGEEAPLDDEVKICKIPAKSDSATLLFNPRDIDFIESMNKMNYVSVRGSLYRTGLTMDELEAELIRFGFFRCHRSYIVNVQKVAKVERYTRNSFNLTLNDAVHSSIPLAKGRAEEMRRLCGW